MNCLGRLLETRYTRTAHHYCADHNLQLTAVKAFTGDIENYDVEVAQDRDGIERTFSALKRARDLVSHIRHSPASKEKLDAAQRRVNNTDPTLVVIQDVKTRWWSTYMMLERLCKLKAAIQDMFYHEFRYRRQCNKTTTLEKYELTEGDFSCLEDVVHVLLPFNVAQEALEGDKYVTLSLLPLLVHQIREALIRFQGAICEETQPQLTFLVDKMKKTLWFDGVRTTGTGCKFLEETGGVNVEYHDMPFGLHFLILGLRTKLQKFLMKMIWCNCGQISLLKFFT
jgi:hypothetical protein